MQISRPKVALIGDDDSLDSAGNNRDILSQYDVFAEKEDTTAELSTHACDPILPTDNFSLRHLRVQPVGIPIIRQDRRSTAAGLPRLRSPGTGDARGEAIAPPQEQGLFEATLPPGGRGAVCFGPTALIRQCDAGQAVPGQVPAISAIKLEARDLCYCCIGQEKSRYRPLLHPMMAQVASPLWHCNATLV